MFVTGRPAASLYAVTRLFCACSATASAAWIVPLTAGAPVIALPGDTPRFPLIVVAPVFVTVVPASTPNDPAVPSPTVAGPAAKRGRSGREHPDRQQRCHAGGQKQPGFVNVYLHVAPPPW